jgi:branched-subunit amino acid transport protein
MEKYYILIIGMAFVTYLPRIIPLFFLQDVKISPKIQGFLDYIPYAALGALILPGVLDSTGNFTYSIVGAGAAILLSLFQLNLLVVVLGSILSVFLFQLWF